jgi:hypothetical protein
LFPILWLQEWADVWKAPCLLVGPHEVAFEHHYLNCWGDWEYKQKHRKDVTVTVVWVVWHSGVEEEIWVVVVVVVAPGQLAIDEVRRPKTGH